MGKGKGKGKCTGKQKRVMVNKDMVRVGVKVSKKG